MKEKLVSIVVPVYKVEKYLERCLTSLINQTYKNIEIILVDDGSPDNCPKLCDEWARRDSRIKVVHKRNEGLGMARNTGIENSTGDYIVFIDSDDYVDIDLVEKTLSIALNDNSDLVMYGYNKVDSKGNVDRNYIPKVNQKKFSGAEIKEILAPELLKGSQRKGKSSNLCLTACGSLFSLNLIKKVNWRFVSERVIISEDVYSLLELINHASNISIVEASYYYYCYNETSLTHSYRKDRYEKIKHFYDETVELMRRCEYSSKTISYMAHPYLSNSMAAMKMILKSDMSRKEKLLELKKIICDSHMKQVINLVDFQEFSILKKIFLTCVKKEKIKICFFLLKLKS